ncbi:MAG: hypothetical protein HYT87_17075 [Nitrospirae bacterium]|nr:hypothetical protein [Nitrospirota bacterium]
MKAMPKHGRFVPLRRPGRPSWSLPARPALPVRRLCAATLLTLFLPVASVRADNVGAPAGVLGRHKVGFSVNSGVFQRDVEFKEGLSQAGAANEDKAVLTSIRPIVLKAQGNILDWLNPYALFGIADLRLDENNYEGTMKPYVGGGAVFRVVDSLEAGPDISFQLHSAYTYSNAYISSENESFDLNYWEVQAALILHKRISNFIPFMGIAYSDTFLSELSGNNAKLDYGARTVPVGLFAGLDYFITPNVYIHSELHNFVEDAIIVGLGFDL